MPLSQLCMWQALETDRNQSLGSISMNGVATVMMPETTGETNKSNADAAPKAAVGIRRQPGK
jgi:hypothetical protein